MAFQEIQCIHDDNLHSIESGGARQVLQENNLVIVSPTCAHSAGEDSEWTENHSTLPRLCFESVPSARARGSSVYQAPNPQTDKTNSPKSLSLLCKPSRNACSKVGRCRRTIPFRFLKYKSTNWSSKSGSGNTNGGTLSVGSCNFCH